MLEFASTGSKLENNAEHQVSHYQRSVNNFNLKKSKSHPDAVPGSLSKSQKGVGTPAGLVLRAEVVWVEHLRVGIEHFVLHEHGTVKWRTTIRFTIF